MDTEQVYERYRELQSHVGWADDDLGRVAAVAQALEPYLPPPRCSRGATSRRSRPWCSTAGCATADHILAYLVKPIKQADLEPDIGLAMRRFEQFRALEREAADLKQALEDGKAIE